MDLINSALLPELWAIIAVYVDPGEMLMLRDLAPSLILTRVDPAAVKMLPPGTVNIQVLMDAINNTELQPSRHTPQTHSGIFDLIDLTRDGMLHMLKWLYLRHPHLMRISSQLRFSERPLEPRRVAYERGGNLNQYLNSCRRMRLETEIIAANGIHYSYTKHMIDINKSCYVWPESGHEMVENMMEVAAITEHAEIIEWMLEARIARRRNLPGRMMFRHWPLGALRLAHKRGWPFCRIYGTLHSVAKTDARKIRWALARGIITLTQVIIDGLMIYHRNHGSPFAVRRLTSPWFALRSPTDDARARRIDAALLPDLWAIVRGYVHVAEQTMIQDLGLALTRGAKLPDGLHLAHVIRDGQLNVLQWVYSAPLPRKENMVRSKWEWVDLNMIDIPEHVTDIEYCPPNGKSRTKMVGTCSHNVRSPHSPHPYHLETLIEVAIFCDQFDILKWLARMVNGRPGYICGADVAAYMSIETLQWLCHRFPIYLDGYRLPGLICGAQRSPDAVQKLLWLESAVSTQVWARATNRASWNDMGRLSMSQLIPVT